MVYVVMGVSGSGKTTVGKLLAQKLRLPFYDGDDFHSAENISKMEAGIPLTDEDREDWLKTLADRIVQWEAAGGAVLACSALKEKYRVLLSSKALAKVEWIVLQGPKDVIKERLLNRKNHFMSSSLINSQFDIWEEPAYGIKISATKPPDIIIEDIVSKLNIL